jgi:hypothetical protein
MVVPNSGAIQFADRHAHLESQKEALLSGHRAKEVELNRSRRRACVSDGHGKWYHASGEFSAIS